MISSQSAANVTPKWLFHEYRFALIRGSYPR